LHPEEEKEWSKNRRSGYNQAFLQSRRVLLMDERFRIYVEQLHDGRETVINEVIEPGFLLISESDLIFKKDVSVQGEAYVASDDLVLHLNIKAEALIPCSICNELVRIDIAVKDFYFSEPLSEIKSGIYSFEELLRETILIEVPLFAECNEGHCTKRNELAKFMKEPKGNGGGSEDTYQPFADLDF
jgi:uncharacterized metal-binding protein YceD (DUF177 family)